MLERCRNHLCRQVALLGVVFAASCGFSPPDNSYQEPPPMEVTVAHPVQQEVTVSIEENGETEPVDRAEVRARVRGFLKEIHFEPGASVTAGQLLYTIEQDEYQAAVSAAEAVLEAAKSAVQVAKSQVGVAQVEVNRAELDYKRTEALLAREAATQSQFDESLAARDAAIANERAATANVASAEAARDQAAADLERAQLDLDYTKVKAPIDGRVTKTEIKLGNLVENGDLMATVVDRSEIYANFNVSDRTLLRLREAGDRRREEAGDDEDPDLRDIPAYLRRGIDQGYPFKGHLDYADQEGVDQATGTFAIRAVFENEDDRLLPGLFVRVKVPVDTIPNALLIPEYALLRDQTGAYVWGVSEDDTLDRRSVTSGEAFGEMIVITHGLGPEDRILLDGFQRARQGAKVNPEAAKPLEKVPMPDAGHTQEQSDPPAKEREETPADGQESSDQTTTPASSSESDAGSDGESESKP